jgi:enoyl-CoA hydratase/carnithine racemase
MSLVRLEDRDGIAIATLDRPPANAFAPELVARLREVLTEAAGARALVLTSANPGIFSAGWDLPRISALSRGEM